MVIFTLEKQVIFEGSEKKFEAIINSDKSLLEFDNQFWHELVSKAQATVLSSVENEYIKSFLLSESSLFVWKDRVLLITCGQTSLVNAIDFLIKNVGKENINSLIFQRKNEYFSHLQPSSFYDDIKVIQTYLEGKAFRLGNMDDHHNFVFTTLKEAKIDEGDLTNELLLYDLPKNVSNFLTRNDLTKKEIRNFLKLDQVIPGFQIDDFVFEPYGYSLNAIKEDMYFTIHITPQENSSYVSFEANFDLCSYKQTVLEVFKPGSFDLINFKKKNSKLDECADIFNYQLKRNVQMELDPGYSMNFSHFFNKERITLSPFVIE